MYIDASPIPTSAMHGATQVVVIEESDRPFTSEAISRFFDLAEFEGDVIGTDGDGDPIYWVVFESEPRRAWDFTERTLRMALAPPSK